MDHTTINTAYLDSPCQELFVGGLGFFVVLTLFWQLIFVCLLEVHSSCTCGMIKLESNIVERDKTIHYRIIIFDSNNS